MPLVLLGQRRISLYSVKTLASDEATFHIFVIVYIEKKKKKLMLKQKLTSLYVTPSAFGLDVIIVDLRIINSILLSSQFRLDN